MLYRGIRNARVIRCTYMYSYVSPSESGKDNLSRIRKHTILYTLTGRPNGGRAYEGEEGKRTGTPRDSRTYVIIVSARVRSRGTQYNIVLFDILRHDVDGRGGKEYDTSSFVKNYGQKKNRKN